MEQNMEILILMMVIMIVMIWIMGIEDNKNTPKTVDVNNLKLGDTVKASSSRFNFSGQNELRKVIEVNEDILRLELIRHPDCSVCESKATNTVAIVSKYWDDINIELV